uniref:Uncharacterized protein n=1 Tax=Peronospora matthiolae TaxID=2874970 RepID=A0AAV1V4J3_9STRA
MLNALFVVLKFQAPRVGSSCSRAAHRHDGMSVVCFYLRQHQIGGHKKPPGGQERQEATFQGRI